MDSFQVVIISLQFSAFAFSGFYVSMCSLLIVLMNNEVESLDGILNVALLDLGTPGDVEAWLQTWDAIVRLSLPWTSINRKKGKRILSSSTVCVCVFNATLCTF